MIEAILCSEYRVNRYQGDSCCLGPQFLRSTCGYPRAEDWLNNGPMQLVDVLPIGWERRTRSVFIGEALKLATLGRRDLLLTKLFALCDRGTDLADCIALAPSFEELDACVECWRFRTQIRCGPTM